MPSSRTPAIALRLIKKTKKEKSLSLDLGCCGLRTIPKEVFELTWLEELRFNNYKFDKTKGRNVKTNEGPLNLLESIPEALARLINLKVLDLSGYDDASDVRWEIDDIPENVLPDSLISLNLRYNQLSEIKGLDQLSSLSSLYLSYNQLSEIKGLDQLSSLSSLYLSYNQLSEIKGLDQLSSLSSLDLSSNQLSEIKGLDQLSSLSSLDLRYNQLSEIKGLDQLSSLSSLDLRYNQLSEIKGLDQLSSLSSLDLRSNQLSEIKGLDQLSSLSSLDLRSNQLSEIKGLDQLSSLSSLYLSYNQLSEIKGLDQLSSLSSLYLSSNQLSEIKGLDQLSSLSSLYLSSNQLSEIKGLDQLSSLSSLDLSYNQLSEIKGLDQLSSLSSLDLRYNQLSEIKGLDQLSSLSSLYLSSNQLSEIKGLDQLSSLSSLYLRYNQLSEIKGLDQLSSLSSLYLSYNQLSEIKGLDQLSSLSSLDLSSNHLSEIKGLDQLSSLSSLDLSSNQLSEIKGLDQLSSLSSLDLSSNQLSEIKGLDQLSSLSSLDLSSNQLSEIKGLDQLSSLSSLDLSSNQLSEIKGLDQLSSLSSLYLSSNQLSEIKGLDQLSSLSQLQLQNNLIKDISSLKSLKNIHLLELNGNQITKAADLKHLTSLRRLKVFNNPLKDCPQALLGNGFRNCFPNIRAWWKEIGDSKKITPNKLVKLQVLGNGNVGKSSLIDALKNGICATKFTSTHGVLLEPVEYETGGEKIQFQAWDFGGQEIYHGTHKLFISSESIQLIVADKDSECTALQKEKLKDRVREDELIALQPLTHFINLSRRQSPGSKIIIVQNKMDDQEEANKAIYKTAADNNLEFCGVSAIKGSGISTLRALLAEKRKGLLQYDMLMPKTWLDVQKFFIDNLRRADIVRLKLITEKEFNDLCAEHNVREQSRGPLKTFLHHSGLIYFDRLLGDLIIADQRWALDAIYKPLDRESDFYDEMRNDYKGRVRVKRVFKAFGSGYSTEQKWLFLQFMQSCGLCFSLDPPDKRDNRREDSYFIFPEFLPENETSSAKELWHSATEIQWYRYNLEYLDYFRVQKFITDIGSKTKHEYIWKNGIVVQSDTGMFRVEADQEKPGIVVGIEQKAVGKLLWKIISTFTESDKENKGKWTMGKDGGEITLDTEELKRKFEDKEKGKDVSEFSEEVDKKGGSLKESLSDVVQTRPKRLAVSYASEDIPARDLLEKSLWNYVDSGRIQLLYDSEVIDGRTGWDESIREMFEEADGFIILASQDYQFFKRKTYIRDYELTLIERRHKEEKIFTFCISVRPVDYSARLAAFPSFRNGKQCLPESGNARDQYMADFAKEIIENKFLK